MRETDPQCRVVIKIDDSDVVALMELLHFIYGGKLSSSTEGSFVTLVDVMLLSDKLQVVSCIEHCIQSLKNLPMTPESAIIYLEIALHDLVRGDIQPLADEAKKFLATRYKDVIKFKEELCNLTLPAIEAIFNGEELKVPSEDCVYDMIMKWAQEQFPSPEERRTVLGSCITRLVRFPYMSPEKLREVLTSHDLDHDFAKDVVNEALFFKVEPRNPRWSPMESSKEAVDRQFVKRNYSRCIYYFDLSLDQCKKLRSGESLDSGKFYLGNQPFCLQAAHRSSESSFALFLIPLDSLSSEIAVCCIFAAMKKTDTDFVEVGTLERKFTDLTGWGRANLFSMPWESFIADDSPYFIDHMLHLRADMSLVE
ncbi:BTB/POZ domain-containing protein POB1 [Acorus calamus]|uniref:BTB/POZ domain-containing protein POB1 n=1 Tax=Acorus calamus TaxID=4465 RepID=A0AAV9F3P7_ACOCL|nr:BTB/POZ domain-containing protein POB1 [Acorus calamus]